MPGQFHSPSTSWCGCQDALNHWPFRFMSHYLPWYFVLEPSWKNHANVLSFDFILRSDRWSWLIPLSSSADLAVLLMCLWSRQGLKRSRRPSDILTAECLLLLLGCTGKSRSRPSSAFFMTCQEDASESPCLTPARTRTVLWAIVLKYICSISLTMGRGIPYAVSIFIRIPRCTLSKSMNRSPAFRPISCQ